MLCAYNETFSCAGIVFTVCCEPYLESEYGADYISETPVKLLDRLLYGQREHIDEEVTRQQLLSWPLQCSLCLMIISYTSVILLLCKALSVVTVLALCLKC